MKKLLSLIFVLVGPVILYTSCFCNCKEVAERFYKVNAMLVNAFTANNLPADEGIPVTTDSIVLNYRLATSCVAYTKNLFSELMNAAYACKCAGCGNEGLKSKIKIFTITSDSDYSSSLPANTNLNGLFRLQTLRGSDTWKGVSIDSTVILLNNSSGHGSGLTLSVKQKPGTVKTHRFKLYIEFQNEEKVEIITKPITWQ